MADPRFHQRSGPFTLEAIAKSIRAVVADRHHAGISIDDVAALESAGPSELSLFYDTRHAAAVRATKAAAVVTSRKLAERAPPHLPLLLADDPRFAFAQAGLLFHPPLSPAPGIDPRASVHPEAAIGPGCRIDFGALVDTGARIGPRCHIGANAVIERGVILEADCRIGANTTISHAMIGARVEIGAGCTIGGPGFGFVAGPTGLVRMPQLGRVLIEDDVRIDANCAVDRGACGDTVIGAGTVIDNLVQVGHNVRIGRFCAIAGQTGIAGSVVIGDGVLIGGQVAISDHVTIGAGARIAIKSGICRDVEPGASVGGYPAVPVRRWHRQTAALGRLAGPVAAKSAPVSQGRADGEAKRRSRQRELVEDEVL